MTERIALERMSYGPAAVGRRADGKTVFVEGAAPGDVVEAEIVEEKPSFARAPRREHPRGVAHARRCRTGVPGAVRRLPVGAPFLRGAARSEARQRGRRARAHGASGRGARGRPGGVLRAQQAHLGLPQQAGTGRVHRRERSLHAGLLSGRDTRPGDARLLPARAQEHRAGPQGAPRRAAVRAGSAGPGHLPGGRARQRAHERRGGGPLDASGALSPHARGGDGQKRPQGHERRAGAGRSRARRAPVKGVEALEGTRMVGRAGGRRAAGGQRRRRSSR